MSHGDKVVSMPEGFETVAESDNCPHATMQHLERALGAPIPPEVVHTPGAQMLKNFAYGICGCSGDGEMAKFVEHTIAKVKETVGDDHILLGFLAALILRVAALLHKAVGDQLHRVYVDNGLMRYKETEEIEALFGDAFSMDLHVVHAGELFLSKLDGVSDPEEKRKIIVFIDVFQKKRAN